jgi:hypothetical protein
VVDSDDAPSRSDRGGREGPGGPTPPAELRAKRVALGVVLVVSLAFIASSSWQIIPAVFGARIDPLPAAAPESPDGRCAAGVRALLGALDRVTGQVAPSTADDDEMAAALRARLSPEWDRAGAVGQACETTPQGQQAWAALQRMKMAEDMPVRMGQDSLALLRVQVTEHLPPDLR